MYGSPLARTRRSPRRFQSCPAVCLVTPIAVISAIRGRCAPRARRYGGRHRRWKPLHCHIAMRTAKLGQLEVSTMGLGAMGMLPATPAPGSDDADPSAPVSVEDKP